MIPAVWYKATLNVGDNLTPFILSRVFHDEVVLSDTPPRWILAGSILYWVKEGDILCGVGSFEWEKKLNFHVKALGVRGPLTAEKLIDEPLAFGDGGLLVPKVYPGPKELGDKLGIIPHYVEYQKVKQANPSAFIINVNQPVERFLSDIFQCKLVLSSSLHGIVLAEAYGIPSFRGSFGLANQIYSFDFKHRDYYEGTGRSLAPITSIEDFLHENVDIEGAKNQLIKVQEAMTRLWTVFTDYVHLYKTQRDESH